MPKLAKRVAQIAPFHVMAILEQAKALQANGEDVIHLEVGEPDFVAAEEVAQAGIQSIMSGKTGYTPATGLPELKQCISQYYRKKYQTEVSPDRIIVTPGASGALLLLSSLLVDSGQKVLMPDPCYPCNRHFVLQVGGEARLIPTSKDDHFAIHLDDLSSYWDEQTVGLWLASPSNPTGSVLSREYVADAYAAVNARDGHLLVDEIYQGLVYEGEDFTALSVSQDIFVINSFSKYFAMTGWRLGWIVVPEWAIEGATKLAQNLFISAPSISQYAAIQAFADAPMRQFELRRRELDKRRRCLLEGLSHLGLDVVTPAQGAFYVYVDVSSITDDAMGWCLSLLREEKVALTPGVDFGIKDADCYVRFAYTCSEDRLKDALNRIGRFLRKQAK